MSPDSTTELGRRGEDLACRHLEAQGLRLLERNYRCRAGEIDLVMLDGSTLVLVEVRSRSTSAHGSAAATVGFRKRDWRSMPVRFDVVAIDPGAMDATGPAVSWIRDAFRIRE